MQDPRLWKNEGEQDIPACSSVPLRSFQCDDPSLAPLRLAESYCCLQAQMSSAKWLCNTANGYHFIIKEANRDVCLDWLALSPILFPHPSLNPLSHYMTAFIEQSIALLHMSAIPLHMAPYSNPWTRHVYMDAHWAFDLWFSELQCFLRGCSTSHTLGHPKLSLSHALTCTQKTSTLRSE